MFKNSLGSGAELLPSWVQDYDMCQDFVGIRCDGRGHVQAILLDDVGVLVEEALELFADMKPISKANGTVTFVPTMTQNSLKLRMHGTLPDSFSQLREVRVL